MDICDFTGGSDFDFFRPKIPDINNVAPLDLDKLTKYSNESIVMSRDMNNNSKASINESETCYPKERCCGEEVEKSFGDQAESQLAKLRQADDPFGMLMKEQRKSIRTSIKQAPTVISPNKCCRQEEKEHVGSRRFLLQFTRTGIAAAKDRSDQCYAAEHARCVDFWAFVQKHNELDRAIKDGSFFHKGRLAPVDCSEMMKKSMPQKPKTRKVATLKYSPSMEELRQRNIRVHAEERKRMEKAHKRFARTNRLSQQGFENYKTRKLWEQKMAKEKELALIAAAEEEPFDPITVLSDCINPNENEVYHDMEKFDEICDNPVKGACLIRKVRRPSLHCAVPKIVTPAVEDAGESEYFDDDETISSDTSASSK